MRSEVPNSYGEWGRNMMNVMNVEFKLTHMLCFLFRGVLGKRVPRAAKHKSHGSGRCHLFGVAVSGMGLEDYALKAIISSS